VVAHPDDEALWFSSILTRVGRVVFCYQDCDDLAELGPGRRRVRESYPLSNVTWLGRPEPCSVGKADWSRPLQTPYGLALNGESAREPDEDRYRSAYHVLSADFREALRGAANVFTHNPWGEYGHPDHVQVSRVIRDLRPELGFRLWYSSYIASRSMILAAQFVPRLVSKLRLPTNRALALELKALYRQWGCWTWDSEYEPPPDEAFLKESETPLREGLSLPLNCVMTV
jgi:LmbE family N-acetylglucosaminyl deacetylase